jgi:hypothetical protein
MPWWERRLAHCRRSTAGTSNTMPSTPTVNAQASKLAAPPRHLSPWAGVLSYLVPGLGQIVQGRIGKGVLFLVCIYTLFFYGLYQGSGTLTITRGDRSETYTMTGPVYLPDQTEGGPFSLPALATNLYNRPQFVGQFWVGIAAWPALWQYFHSDKDAERQLDKFRTQRDQGGENGGNGDLQQKIDALEQRIKKGDRWLGRFQRTPSDETINAVQTAGDKRLEIAWVCTVIAGVLNIMVIYDAIAGPAFLAASENKAPKPKTEKAVA